MTRQTQISWVALMKNLQRAIRNIDQYIKQLSHSEHKERRKRFAARLADNPAGCEEFRAIREAPARPILFLADDEGTLHTDPMKTDNMTKAWAEVLRRHRQDRRTKSPRLQGSLRAGYVQRKRTTDHRHHSRRTPRRIQTCQEERIRPRRVGRRNTQQSHVHPTTMAGDDPQRNRERDEMAKTDHQSARDLHTKGEQSKPRPTIVQSLAHHVTDLQEMGIDEAQTFITSVWNTGEAGRRKLQGVPLTSTNALIRLSGESCRHP